MKILVTGAFGNLGLMCVERALALGHEVRCFDVPTKKNRQTARAYSGRVESIFGDIRNSSAVEQVVKGVEGIIHNASVLPPVTETNSLFAQAVNVEGTRLLIASAEAESTQSSQGIRFVFPSSVTVFGLPAPKELPRTVDDPVESTDHYTRHKLQCESIVKQSTLDWSILRVGVSVDSRTLSTDWATFTSLLRVKADNPLEYVHPKDVASAMCEAVTRKAAIGKTLLIGGGKHCQITQGEFLGTALQACGLTLDRRIFGQQSFYTHWMDTRESQRILNYQQYTFSHYESEMQDALAGIRRLLTPIRPIVNKALAYFLGWTMKY
ncbi:hypothetical protein A9Q99_21245 [Gammaproteobacteria bacterium 45_16_T64]|nr:hypothetical protein A9Q99_21245 [Gammaproteobacteria bacterium 45_16_T64]